MRGERGKENRYMEGGERRRNMLGKNERDLKR